MFCNFQAEVLNVHLDNSETERARCQLALSDAVSKINIVQEDQEVQEGNYKTQLSTMTEHLANMNDKLIKQTEEIQQLKFQLVQKVGNFDNTENELKNKQCNVMFRFLFFSG